MTVTEREDGLGLVPRQGGSKFSPKRRNKLIILYSVKTCKIII